MNLVDLDPEFIRLERDEVATIKIGSATFSRVASIAEADGIFFLCPKCFETKGGPIGTHRVICWRPQVPQTIHPVPGRWEFQGTGFADLSLVAGSSSVLLTSGCMAHFFVRSGRIETC